MNPNDVDAELVARLPGQRIVVCQQRDTGGAFGQHWVLRGAGGIQVVAGGIRQLPALQGKFASQTGL